MGIRSNVMDVTRSGMAPLRERTPNNADRGLLRYCEQGHATTGALRPRMNAYASRPKRREARGRGLTQVKSDPHRRWRGPQRPARNTGRRPPTMTTMCALRLIATPTGHLRDDNARSKPTTTTSTRDNESTPYTKRKRQTVLIEVWGMTRAMRKCAWMGAHEDKLGKP